MKFTALAMAGLAAVAAASPVASAAAPVSSLTAVNVTVPALPEVTTALQSNSVQGVLFCEHIVRCIEELADVVSTCGMAAAQSGMNVVEDVKCLMDAAEMITKVPRACKGCLKL